MSEYPLCIEELNGEEGYSYVSKGHHDKVEFSSILLEELRDYFGRDDLFEEGDFSIDIKDVCHVYMKVEQTDNEVTQWIESSSEHDGAFPATYWNN